MANRTFTNGRTVTLPPAARTQCVQMRRGGMSLVDVAAHFNVSVGVVCTTMRLANGRRN